MYLCVNHEIKAVLALWRRIIFLLLQPASEEEGLVNEEMESTGNYFQIKFGD